jgi:hypothetical protein
MTASGRIPSAAVREVREALSGVESAPHPLPISRSRHAMPSWTDMLGDGTICGEEPLRVPRGFEPLQAPRPLACRLVGSLRTAVQRLVLPMFDTGPPLPLGHALVPPPWRHNIEDIPVLIHRPPQIVAFAATGEKDLVQMPRVTRLRAPTTELIGIRLAERLAPLADGFS